MWREKRDTDYAYNECVKLLIDLVSQDVASVSTSTPTTVESSGAWGWSSWLWGTSRHLPNTTHPQADSATPRIGVLFGTHNWESCALILKELVQSGLAVNDTAVEGGIKVESETVERVAIGQLYGTYTALMWAFF